MEKITCQAAWLGTLPYETAWRMQERMAGEIARGERPPSLLLLEHPNTYTAGRSTKPGHLLWGESELKQNDVAYYDVDRGGDITYHGPGQLVGYPLLKLDPMDKSEKGSNGVDTVGYVRKIEQTLIKALADFGIQGFQKEGFSGVWVSEERVDPGLSGWTVNKIASIGVKVDVNRVTRHGFALNVDPDMRYWGGIIACGLEGAVMTSMAACLGRKPVMEDVIKAVLSSFEGVFGYQIVIKQSQ